MRFDFLLEDPAVVENLYAAVRLDPLLKTRCRISPVGSWDELVTRAEGSDFDVAVVQPSFSLSDPVRGDGRLGLLRLSNHLGPGRLIAFICQAPSSSGLLQNLGGLLDPIVLIKGVDDEPRIILRALARSWVRSRLVSSAPTPPQGKEALPRQSALATMIGWPPARSAQEAAKQLRLGVRTHRRQLRDAGLPSPAVLIRWGRFLEALTLWSMGVQSRTRIARILGMGRADTLSTLARRLTGESWEVVAENGPQETSIEGVFVFQGAKPA